jgi:FemAB-related protein (PEP-CTERM system-associated)
MQIKLLSNSELESWNEYVAHNPLSSFCHRAEWKSILEKSYDIKTHYMYAEDNDVIKGILPLAEVKSIIFGHTLISTPFCVYGGICSDTEEISALLCDEAIRLGKELGVDYVEFRNLSDQQNTWSGKDFYHTFKKKISANYEENFQAIPRKQRAMVRKGINNNLHSEIDSDTDRFYDIYSISVRNLGTPVYPKIYFENLKEDFGTDCEILTVLHGGKPISSVLSFYSDEIVMPYYGGGLAEARQLKAYDFMYWELMRRSCENNIRCFDFGRSIEGTGSFSFKKNWGFKPEKLYYRQFLVEATQTPDFSPMDKKYSIYIKMWKKLPLPIANLIGPMISRNLG